jgi:hypothetical protein
MALPIRPSSLRNLFASRSSLHSHPATSRSTHVSASTAESPSLSAARTLAREKVWRGQSRALGLMNPDEIEKVASSAEQQSTRLNRTCEADFCKHAVRLSITHNSEKIHGAPPVANQVLSNESEAIPTIQVSTEKPHLGQHLRVCQCEAETGSTFDRDRFESGSRHADRLLNTGKALRREYIGW